MAGYIPEEKIAEIRNTANVVELVSDYVALKRAGKNFVGLCPFHAEKDGSFTVSEEKQIFHCFGCGKGGNVFDFLMLYHHVSFPEAVRMLGQRCGIAVETAPLTAGQRRQREERDRIVEVNKRAREFFRRNLRGPSGKPAQQYLEQRGIGRDVAERFSLGFAPKGWENLAHFFSNSGVSLQDAEKAGLVVSKQRGFYDRFRSRIIFPISDIQGQVLGFGGRSLDDTLPKYLNSPETPVYRKGRILYGLDVSKDACRQRGFVYVVEGYFDLLALHCHGVKNVVATLGTALTKEHIRALKGYGRKAVLVFDSDDAGRKAAERSFSLFLDEKVEAQVLTLPAGHDPDSFVRASGGEAFEKRLDGAMDMVEFLIVSAVDKYGLSLQGKVSIVEALKGPLASLPDGVTRSLYVKRLAEKLTIDESAILEQVRDSAGEKRGAAAVQNQPPTGSRLEEHLITMMLHAPHLLSCFDAAQVVDTFETETLKKIGRMVIAQHRKLGDTLQPDAMMDAEDPTIRSVVSSLSMQEGGWDRDSCLALVRQYQNQLQKKKKRLLSSRIKEAEDACDEALVLELLAEKQRRLRKDAEVSRE